MTSTADLDATITLLNGMLAKAKTTKDKLAITDRLIRAHGLKAKYATDGKGGKFASLADEPHQGTTTGHHNGN